MIEINNIPFQNEICAYRLTAEALYHQNPPFYSTLPGEALYEITQIFLERIQAFAETANFNQIEKNVQTKKFFAQNFPSQVQDKPPAYPVELLFSAYAIQDMKKRSPLSLFYSCTKGQIPQHFINQAKKLTHSLMDFEQVIHDPKTDSECFKSFDRSWMYFLNSINELQSSDMKTSCFLFQNGSSFFKKYYQKENFGTYCSEPTYKINSVKYRECFDELCRQVEKRGKCEDFTEFLNEWKTLSEGTKDNARNHDPFVKAFQNTLDKIRELSIFSLQSIM